VHDKPADGDDVVEKLDADERRRLIRRMRLQIWAGALAGAFSLLQQRLAVLELTPISAGLFIALCIGAACVSSPSAPPSFPHSDSPPPSLQLHRRRASLSRLLVELVVATR